MIFPGYQRPGYHRPVASSDYSTGVDTSRLDFWRRRPHQLVGRVGEKRSRRPYTLGGREAEQGRSFFVIAIVDFGAGNLRSVTRAIAAAGHPSQITSDPAFIAGADGVILPGVGSAGDAMNDLRQRGLVEPLRLAAAEGRPLLGICLGLQLLFDSSEEDDQRCLGIVPGTVKKLPRGRKVPHMGWNEMGIRKFHAFLEGIDEGAYAYFVHSYYVEPAATDCVVATTNYGLEFPALVADGNVIGTQFHPEKSGETGLTMYRNFCDLVAAASKSVASGTGG